MDEIFQRVEANVAIGITELKRNPAAVMKMAEEQAVAVLSHNKVIGYVVSPEAWELAQEVYDDLKLGEMIDAQKNEKSIPVKLDEL